MKNKLIKAIIIITAVIPCNLQAQNSPKIPIDTQIRYGKLENGLTYYIRANKEPKQRAEFYIAQNVGAILENDNQNGLAHFLEHMAFNGTKHFPGKGIINYLEKNGVKFGQNINAYTSLDETVYNLSDVPTTRDGIIDSALLILHDWSSYISLESPEIDAERGVILEEWRTGAGPERRMWKESNKLKYKGSQYAIRDVIGDTAIIKHFSHQTIRDFYQKWYRPDLQAILIVGDIDVDAIENKIKTLFTGIPKQINPAERIVYKIPENGDPIIAIVQDSEARITQIEFEYKQDILPLDVKSSKEGYTIGICNSLISNMIGNRFDEITQQSNAPFVQAMGYYGELVKTKDAFQFAAIPKEGKEIEGLNALALEIEKIKRFGFTQSEFDRSKANLLLQIKTAYNEKDKQDNNTLVREYVRHFTSNEVIPGIEWEYIAIQALLPKLLLTTVNDMAKSYITDSNLIVTILAPTKETVKLPNNDQIISALKNAKAAQITPIKDEINNKKLIEKNPKKGHIKKQSRNTVLGTIEWKLNNGVKVIIKPTKYKNDQIILQAYSDGGFSKLSNKDDLMSASFSTTITANNGIGDFTLIELEKLLAGKSVSVTPYINEFEEGFSGNSSVSDFNTMLQLLYLNFTSPRNDDDAFEALMNLYRAGLANTSTDPKKIFSDSISVTVSNHSPRTMIVNLETIKKVDQFKALTIFKERFSNPADFTFVFTGNINTKDKNFKKAICTYLGGLPTNKSQENVSDNGIRKPTGIVKNYFSKTMQIAKASNFILYSGAMPYNIKNKVVMNVVGDILNLRYTESIREKEGGSYGVSVRAGLTNNPLNEATITMRFDTEPDKQGKLMSIIHAEVEKIIVDGPRSEDLQKVKENLLKKHQENLNENNWWSNAITSFYHNKLNYIADYEIAIKELSVSDIQNSLKSLVKQGNIIEVVMKP